MFDFLSGTTLRCQSFLLSIHLFVRQSVLFERGGRAGLKILRGLFYGGDSDKDMYGRQLCSNPRIFLTWAEERQGHFALHQERAY